MAHLEALQPSRLWSFFVYPLPRPQAVTAAWATLLLLNVLTSLDRESNHNRQKNYRLDIFFKPIYICLKANGDCLVDANQKPVNSASSSRITQGRSPAYPYIGLGKAVERLQKIVDAGVARNAYPPETFYKLWDLGAQSSGARQTMAALNHFGLVEYDGRGDSRKVKVSELGLKIALDRVPNSHERIQAIQLAALTPIIYSDLYQRYKHMLPADVVLMTYLTRDRAYNPTAAASLIDEYRDTLSFAQLDKPEDDLKSNKLQNAGGPAEVQVGDSVLIEIDGVLQFKEAKRVEEIQELDGTVWVFVEGEKTAVRLDQVVVQEGTNRTAVLPPTRSMLPPKVPEKQLDDEFLPAGWMEERLLDDGGEEIKIRYQGKASIERYKFIRDYLDFKIERAEKLSRKREIHGDNDTSQEQ